MPARARLSIAALLLATAALASHPARADDAPSWATAQATELSRQAREHAARGEPDVAVGRYVDALALDPTYGPAYLGLAALYEARGDVSEAERTYAVGLDHVPGFADAFIGRGRLRMAQRRLPDAIADLEAAAAIRPEAGAVLGDLEAAYIASGALPAALAVARRRAALAEAQQDAHAAAAARTSARALGLLVGDADPVGAGRAGRGPARHALALVALGARRR